MSRKKSSRPKSRGLDAFESKLSAEKPRKPKEHKPTPPDSMEKRKKKEAELGKKKRPKSAPGGQKRLPDEKRSSASPSLPSWLVPGLLALAFILRMLYLKDFSSSPFYHGLVLDEAHYEEWARRIAEGDVLGKGAFTANPLGPYMIAAVYAVLGHHLNSLRIVQMIASVASCYFIYGFTRSIAGEIIATIALFLMAIYGPFIFISANPVAEVWVFLFVSAALFLLTHDRARPWWRVAAGALFAIGALGRPNIILLAPLLPLADCLRLERFAKKTKLDRFTKKIVWRRFWLWTAGVCMILGPVTLRNYVEGGEVVVFTAHGGVNLWIGNNPKADGYFKTPRGSGLAGGQKSLVASSIRVAEKASHRKLRPSESSSWWVDRALRYMQEDTGDYLLLMLRKVGLYLNVYEKPLESNYYYGRQLSPFLRYFSIGFGVMAPLAFAGMILLRRRWREWAIPYVFVLVYSASVVLYFVSMRYRLPVVIALAPFAGATLSTVLEKIRAADYRAILPVAGLVGIGAVLVFLPLARGELEQDLGHNEYILGNVAQDGGDSQKALEHYERAVELYPDWGGFYNNLGLAYIRTKQPEKAIAALNTGIKLDYASRRLYRNLAKAYRMLRQPEKAAEAYHKALERSPRHAATWVDLANVQRQLGRTDDARRSYETALEHTKNKRLIAAASRGLKRLEMREHEGGGAEDVEDDVGAEDGEKREEH